MKRLLLLLLIGVCTSVYGKNKAATNLKSTQGISLKGIENTILYQQSGEEFSKESSVYNPYLFVSPFEDEIEYGSNSFISDLFFENSEFSYKMIASNNAGGSFFLDRNTTHSQKATLEPSSLFSQGMFYGFTIMLVLLNLACFFLFEEKTFLYYSAALGSTAVLFFFSDGLLNLLGLEPSVHVQQVQTSLLVLFVASQALFASKYLNLKEFAPKIKWFAFGLLGFAMVNTTFYWSTGTLSYAQIATISLFTVLIGYFVVGIGLFSKKNYAKFYVVATFIPLLFSIDFFVLKSLGIEFLSTETFHIKASAIAEMLILTYAIVYRMQAIKEENELRQVEMRIFLKRQEALTARQKTEKLVEDVYLENLIMHYDLDGLEIKLLQYISEGKDNAKIARKLKTNETEVEELTKELYQKLEISEQIQQDYRLVEQQPDYIYN